MARIIPEVALLAATFGLSVHAQYTATYDPNQLPATTEQDQTGTNQCGTANNQSSLCQNLWVNSVQDFCIWGPPEPNSIIGNVEEIVVAYCTQPGRGTRLIPQGTLLSAHFVETPDYIQVTGIGQLSNVGIDPSDGGGELDPHGADGFGNPHGGLVFSTVWNAGTNGLGSQIHEWTNFMANTEYCIRVCKEDDPQKTSYCQHVYDTLGCRWNMPGDYDTQSFTQCMGDSVIPMGLYPQPDGSTSTADPHPTPVPAAQPAGATSQCQTFTSALIYTSAPAAPSNGSSSSTSIRGSSTGSSGSHATSSTPAPTNTTGGASMLGLPINLLFCFIGMIMSVTMIL